MPLGQKYAEVSKFNFCFISYCIIGQNIERTRRRRRRRKYSFESLTKVMQLLPWGDKLTSESLRFFSPIVIWTKFATSQYMHQVLYSAFKDYFEVTKLQRLVLNWWSRYYESSLTFLLFISESLMSIATAGMAWAEGGSSRRDRCGSDPSKPGSATQVSYMESGEGCYVLSSYPFLPF